MCLHLRLYLLSLGLNSCIGVLRLHLRLCSCERIGSLRLSCGSGKSGCTGSACDHGFIICAGSFCSCFSVGFPICCHSTFGSPNLLHLSLIGSVVDGKATLFFAGCFDLGDTLFISLHSLLRIAERIHNSGRSFENDESNQCLKDNGDLQPEAAENEVLRKGSAADLRDDGCHGVAFSVKSETEHPYQQFIEGYQRVQIQQENGRCHRKLEAVDCGIDIRIIGPKEIHTQFVDHCNDQTCTDHKDNGKSKDQHHDHEGQNQ